MRRLLAVSCSAAILAGTLAFMPAARAQESKAEQILKEIAKVEMPKLDAAKRSNPTAVQEYIKAQRAAVSRRSELVGQLIKADPKNPKVAELLQDRVTGHLMSGPEGADAARAELQKLQKTVKEGKTYTETCYWLTILNLRSRQGDAAAMLKDVEAFTKQAPKDDRGAMLLYSVASRLGQTDEAKQNDVYKRIVKDYPGSRMAKMVEGHLRQLEAVGKPFELEFNDAIKGTTVSMKDLRGKVVVIDFWATWCGPCVGEMPNMKKLYAEYKPKGVEFIGVSLDEPKEQGGLDKLKEFVAKNEITWPQYYQGKGWESEFSASWGINSIPAVFVVDPQGKLHSINARGKLEEMIPELLKKAKASSAGAGAGAGGQ